MTPRSFFTPGKDPVPIVQETGWAAGPVWTGAENLAPPTGIRFPDRPARTQWLYRLSYLAQNVWSKKVKNVKWSRYMSCVAQRVGRGIALLFHDRGTRSAWMVSSTPRPHFTLGKVPVPTVQEAQRVKNASLFSNDPGLVLTFFSTVSIHLFHALEINPGKSKTLCFTKARVKDLLNQCFLTAGLRPVTGPWHQLYRAARDSC